MKHRVRSLQGQRGFTLVELLVVMLISGVVGAAILGLYASVSRTTADQTVRIQNQDSARTAMYTMSRYIRSACSSDSNLSSLSDSLLLTGPHELVFFVDLDQDDSAERVRYSLSGATLLMQTVEPVAGNPPTYPVSYGTNSLVIDSGIRNGGDAVFVYYGYDEDTGSLYEIASPNTAALRRAIVTVGIRLKVNERPEIAKGNAELSTHVLIRQRYDGGLNGG